MSLNRALLIGGAVAVIAAWPFIPDAYRVEWPLTTFLVVTFIALVPSRLAMRFRWGHGVRSDAAPDDWRTQWWLPIVGLPFALMIDASTSQGAISYGHWALGLLVVALLVWYAMPAFNSRTR
jgi:hypothetical protein